ncbi:MAG: hypothetical protein M3439_04335 [Chloroflexota bacterium]|nr:hypothetical protein [Chloroflexota bacterium]
MSCFTTVSPCLRPLLETHGGAGFLEAAQRQQAALGSNHVGNLCGAVKDLFDGATSEDDEDEALAMLLAATTSQILGGTINCVEWTEMDDELDEPDLDAVMRRMEELLDHEQYLVRRVLRRVYLRDPTAVVAMTPTERSATINAISVFFLQFQFQELIARRVELLTSIGWLSLRNRQPTWSTLLTDIMRAPQNPITDPAFQILRWEIHYTTIICDTLGSGNISLLMVGLSDMANPLLPPAQRSALLSMLLMWEPELRAMATLLVASGSAVQSAQMNRFMAARQIFLDSIPNPAVPPAPGALDALLAALAGIMTAVNNLATAFDNISQTLANAAAALGNITFSLDLFGSNENEVARNTTNMLSGSGVLARIPFYCKLEPIQAMLDNTWTEDEEEDAILLILKATKGRSVAEFAQLSHSATWEKLYTSIDGTQYNTLEGLYTF